MLVSGGGSNLQALIDAEARGELGRGKISLVISSRDGVYAIERARAAGIPVLIERPNFKLPRKRQERRREHSSRILRHCRENNIDLIVHAGFLSVLAGDIIKEYSGRMMNIHPALLPKHGGHGMYGENVHQAVLDAGDAESGCTVHYVNAGIDAGPVILQRKVPVLPGDTITSLAERILIEEHIAIVEAVKILLSGRG